jgi:hypothetical protein
MPTAGEICIKASKPMVAKLKHWTIHEFSLWKVILLSSKLDILLGVKRTVEVLTSERTISKLG